MLRALAAILVTTSFVSTAGAQSNSDQPSVYVEENATNAACEWTYKGKTHFGICHILAMGTHAMDDTVLLFTLPESDQRFFLHANLDGPTGAEKGTGGFWDFHANWKGKYTESWEQVKGNEDYVPQGDELPLGIHTIHTGKGYTIKMVY